MSATTGNQGWAQLRQQARSLEAQVFEIPTLPPRRHTSTLLMLTRHSSDGNPIPYVLPILHSRQHTTEADQRGARDGGPARGIIREGKP